MQTIERQVNEKIREAVPVEVKVYEEGDTTLKEVINVSENKINNFSNNLCY